MGIKGVYCSSTELDGEGDEAVVMLNVALENVGAGAQHPLKSETRLALVKLYSIWERHAKSKSFIR